MLFAFLIAEPSTSSDSSRRRFPSAFLPFWISRSHSSSRCILSLGMVLYFSPVRQERRASISKSSNSSSLKEAFCEKGLDSTGVHYVVLVPHSLCEIQHNE